MNAGTWHARYTAWRFAGSVQLYHLGVWPFVVASALVVFALGQWVALPVLKRERAAAEQALTQALAATAHQIPTDTAETLQTQRHAALMQTLPGRQETGRAFAQIHKIAAKQGVVISQVEYSDAAADRQGLVQTQMRLPLKGSYAAIRGFCEQVLRVMPYVSVDEISFKREEIGQAQVDAKIRLSIWLRTTDRAVPLADRSFGFPR